MNMAVLNVNSPGLDRAVLDASNRTGVPNFVLAGMYESGFNGDPQALATKLKYWFNATGGTSWNDALAAYHAGSVHGVLDKNATDYARQVILSSRRAPSGLLGSQSISDALGLAIPEILGGVSATIGAAGVAADAAAADAAAGAGEATAGASAGESAASGAAGGGAASAAKGATQGAGKAVGSGIAGLFGALSDWQQILVRGLQSLAGIALLLLGLEALTGIGGQGSPISAVKRAIK